MSWSQQVNSLQMNFTSNLITILLQIQEEIFSQRPVNTDKPDFVSYLAFIGVAASFTVKISSFNRNCRETRHILNPVPALAPSSSPALTASWICSR